MRQTEFQPHSGRHPESAQPFLLFCRRTVLPSIFFRMMVSTLGSAGIEPPSPILPIEPCAFGH
jgi:hypothetical protein